LFIAAANFRGPGARQIFPCWDEPNIRTNFTISVKHHQNYKALSNAPFIEKHTDDKSMTWINFEPTDKISSYHVAVIVFSNLERSYKAVVSEKVIGWWCREEVEQEIKFAQTIANDATLYLKNISLLNFPHKLDHIIVPGFRYEGVESWGLVLYK